MGEYEKFDVTELYEMTSADDGEALEKIGVGWANTSTAIGAIHEALIERLKAIKKVWSSESAGPFQAVVNETIAHLDAAKTQADNRAKAVGSVASYAKWAREKVAEQHVQYQKAVLGNAADVASGKYAPPLGFGNPFVLGPKAEGPPSADEIRKPFDEQARKYMNVALKDYEQNKPHIESEIRPIKPVRISDEAAGDWSDGQDSWAGDGGSGSNTYDMAGLSATSYGGNALGAHPELQSGGPHTPTTPTHTAPTGPHPTGMPGPTQTGVPLGGVPPLSGGNKPPTAPPKLPTAPTTNARNTLGPRGPISAPRTPGLPARTSPPVRSMTTPNSATNRWAGRGLQKSQMAPVNRVGEPRKSGEVLGRRSAPAKPTATTQPAPRRVQPSVIRGANKPGTKSSGKSPVDNTNRGYTSRVINPRDRIAEAKGHSRTPLVGDKMKHPAKPEPFGKRPEPETARSLLRREINEAREKRRKLLKQSDGLSRPVIDNGLSNSAQIDHAIPTPREAVKSEDGFWQPPKDMVPGVIGKRTWDPNAITHDPGPVFGGTAQGREEPVKDASHDPGPTAFDPQRGRPDTSHWPGT
ncbi:hypothetical protein [Stackebrandtia nassauensis]|uniref:PPE family domain-containing protein n=1 Tax=Stackebrandtia nassauensis (strain DSM 44728 / CIP 108903 / NRRL B-16338 / NBRC 102104 / LLR-40K-21) TaxID=446470 RepID=D3Q6M1_STANL|nr:hypothetical protein [Stackebrandtia nassauensis]ADD44264.1 hypothetical protein Snas_4621 [Stackebrandtia nassauensis DSM 44728]